MDTITVDFHLDLGKLVLAGPGNLGVIFLSMKRNRRTLEDDWHEGLLELWGRYSRSGYLVWEATKLRAMPLLDVCRSQQNAWQYEQYA